MHVKDLHAAKFVLVDHYRPTYPSIRKEKVAAIFDHHMDYTDVLPDMPAAFPDFARIKKYGSSATVVSEFVFEMMGEKKPTIMDMAVLRLLQGPIYLDTDNLKEGKAAPEDIKINENIEKLLNIPKGERDSMYQALGVALVDLTGLNPTQILRKDLKIASFDVKTQESSYKIKVAVPYMPMAPLVKPTFRFRLLLL